jgi:hypothetical protein
MTLLDERPSTSTGPTARGMLHRNRAAIVLVVALVGVLALLAVIGGGGRTGQLDPDAYDPTGAHALATLLRDRGVDVQRTTDLPSTVSAATATSTVFVPLPQLLSDEELTAVSNLPGNIVVVGAGPSTPAALLKDVEVIGTSEVKARDPHCSLEAASNAGRAESGGFTYRAATDAATGCYANSGGPTLLALPTSRLVLVGSGLLFSNGHLAKQGNAALAVGLLGQTGKVVWLVPSPNRAAFGARPISSPDDLLPAWVKTARLQLFVAVGVLALWRARRLGRVVPEPLPVVVRAAETVEGRGRLYRAAGARGAAAEALRNGARDRLAPLVGAGRTTEPEALCALVAARTGGPTAAVAALLYGPCPADDAALVRLADDLDALIREVAGS